MLAVDFAASVKVISIFSDFKGIFSDGNVAMIDDRLEQSKSPLREQVGVSDETISGVNSTAFSVCPNGCISSFSRAHSVVVFVAVIVGRGVDGVPNHRICNTAISSGGPVSDSVLAIVSVNFNCADSLMESGDYVVTTFSDFRGNCESPARLVDHGVRNGLNRGGSGIKILANPVTYLAMAVVMDVHLVHLSVCIWSLLEHYVNYPYSAVSDSFSGGMGERCSLD